MMTLTTIPTSTFQMIANVNVRNISARSIQASILGLDGEQGQCDSCVMRARISGVLPVVGYLVRGFCE
jgi:hypothetical protein